MTIIKQFEESTGLIFRNKLDFILFILFNIIATPIIPLLIILKYMITGIIVYGILFFLLYFIWKWYGKHDVKISFSPSFKFGNKKYRI